MESVSAERHESDSGSNTTGEKSTSGASSSGCRCAGVSQSLVLFAVFGVTCTINAMDVVSATAITPRDTARVVLLFRNVQYSADIVEL